LALEISKELCNHLDAKEPLLVILEGLNDSIE
jgi:hypothetical protein